MGFRCSFLATRHPLLYTQGQPAQGDFYTLSNWLWRRRGRSFTVYKDISHRYFWVSTHIEIAYSLSPYSLEIDWQTLKLQSTHNHQKYLCSSLPTSQCRDNILHILHLRLYSGGRYIGKIINSRYIGPFKIIVVVDLSGTFWTYWWFLGLCVGEILRILGTSSMNIVSETVWQVTVDGKNY